jgi:hypothetical protein
VSNERVSASATCGLNSKDIQPQANKSSRIRRKITSQKAACLSRLLSFRPSSSIGSRRRKFTPSPPFEDPLR